MMMMMIIIMITITGTIWKSLLQARRPDPHAMTQNKLLDARKREYLEFLGMLSRGFRDENLKWPELGWTFSFSKRTMVYQCFSTNVGCVEFYFSKNWDLHLNKKDWVSVCKCYLGMEAYGFRCGSERWLVPFQASLFTFEDTIVDLRSL